MKGVNAHRPLRTVLAAFVVAACLCTHGPESVAEGGNKTLADMPFANGNPGDGWGWLGAGEQR